MKGIILKQDEILTLQDAGKVTVWRDVKPQPDGVIIDIGKSGKPCKYIKRTGGGWWAYDIVPAGMPTCVNLSTTRLAPCSYGQPGEVRYVKETWRPWAWHEGERWVFQYGDGNRMEALSVDVPDEYEQEEWEIDEWIKISDELSDAGHKPGDDDLYHFDGDPPLKWRPSSTMPKWASRYTVKCTAVTVDKRGDVWQWGIELEKVDR